MNIIDNEKNFLKIINSTNKVKSIELFESYIVDFFENNKYYKKTWREQNEFISQLLGLENKEEGIFGDFKRILIFYKSFRLTKGLNIETILKDIILNKFQIIQESFVRNKEENLTELVDKKIYSINLVTQYEIFKELFSYFKNKLDDNDESYSIEEKTYILKYILYNLKRIDENINEVTSNFTPKLNKMIFEEDQDIVKSLIFKVLSNLTHYLKGKEKEICELEKENLRKFVTVKGVLHKISTNTLQEDLLKGFKPKKQVSMRI